MNFLQDILKIIIKVMIKEKLKKEEFYFLVILIMKILLDIRGPRRGGTWTYTKFLVPELIKAGKDHQFTVLYDSSQERFDIGDATEEVLTLKNKISWMLWSHFSLPR